MKLKMMTIRQTLSFATLAFALGGCVYGQVLPVPAASQPLAVAPLQQSQSANMQSSTLTQQPLFDFNESDIKFNLHSLMSVLRDARHEGWVLAAYPDPKTKKPLIGAGFSLDLEARDHPQLDPLNPHPFVEPSSAQLWQAAGLEPERLQSILDRYNRDLKAWTARKYRHKIRARTLTPQISEEDATRLLRISAIQAISNAKGYCRDFDQLTGPQQMAMSQLVFQMGVNLEEFVQFLGVINHEASSAETNATEVVETDADHWKTVQHTLMESQWATHYSSRAISVIAMFDPGYSQNPIAAERQVAASLHPAVIHTHRTRAKGQLHTASLSKDGGMHRKSSSSSKRRRKLA